MKLGLEVFGNGSLRFFPIYIITLPSCEVEQDVIKWKATACTMYSEYVLLNPFTALAIMHAGVMGIPPTRVQPLTYICIVESNLSM
jgi:hypothetical protein